MTQEDKSFGYTQDKCAKYDNCVGSEPFFVGSNNPSFPSAKNGYLPSLCGDCPDFVPVVTQEIIERKTIYTENLTDGQFLQLQALVHNLRTTLQKHITNENQYTNKKGSSKKVYQFSEVSNEE